jgi:hypothetical protein
LESYPTNNTMIHRAALKIAGKGRPVFPCRADKAPYTERGFKDATTHPGRINAFWNRHPDAKIGMPTGSASGVFVVDVDRLAALGELPQELPETLTIRTGRGGLHYYFKYVDGITNKTGGLPTGIDVRGDGGYVIAYPSPGYTVERRAPIADAPEWLLNIIKSEPQPSREPGQSRTRANIIDDGEPIPDGRRNETLTSIAGRLHDGTRDLGQLEDDLLDVNEARCAPPLSPEQVRRIARSIYRYEPCRPARREHDPETVEALARAERIILGREWPGKGGKTRYSLCVAWLKIARRYAVRVEDGVRLEISWRQLALATGVSRPTAMKGIKDMPDMFRTDNEGAKAGKSGAIIFLLPPARIFTTLPTESVIEGGCKDSRAPFTAPRLRWSSPAYKPRRGLVQGTTKVRNAPIPEKRAAVIRLGKSCERVMDSLEAAGGSMTLDALADAIDIKRKRELTRRKNLETGKGRDGFVTRLQDVGVLEVVGDTVALANPWLEALDRERDRAGEIDLYRRDMARYNRQSKAFRNRDKVEADPAPSAEEMQAMRESYPDRRRKAIEIALARLFREHPGYRGLRAGQITCRLMFYLPEDFPRGPDGAPKDVEVEALLDGESAA